MQLRRLLLGAFAILALPGLTFSAELTGYLTHKNTEAGTLVVDNVHPMRAAGEVDLDRLEIGRRVAVTYDGPETEMVATAVRVEAPAIPAATPASPPPPPAAAAAPAAAEPPAEVAQAAPPPAPPAAPAAEGGASTASYTAEQADRGEGAYMDECAGCHGSTLGGGGETPGLIGSGFRSRWFANGDAADLHAYISTQMPQQAPGSLSPQTYADITAYLMQRNQIPAGTTEFAAAPLP